MFTLAPIRVFGESSGARLSEDNLKGDVMRAEMQALADKIEQSLVLLRRHL